MFDTLYSQQLSDRASSHQQGSIYLIEAVGFHGFLPGCCLKRVKIGLSTNPQARLETFQQNQPPCDLRLLRVIHVGNMNKVEDELHSQFAASNVKLLRSREWFDIWPWQMWSINSAFDRYEAQYSWRFSIPFGGILIGGAISLLTLAVTTSSQPIPKLTPPALQSTIIPKPVKTKAAINHGH